MDLDLQPLRTRMIHDTERFLERNLPPRDRRRISGPVLSPASVPYQYGPSAAAQIARAIIVLVTSPQPSFRSKRARTGPPVRRWEMFKM